MARGFLGGLVIGGVFSVAAASLISVFAPTLAPPRVAETVPNVAAPEAAARSDQTASDQDGSIATATDAPQMQAPDTDDTVSVLETAANDTGSQPQAGGADSLAAPTNTGGLNGPETPQTDAPVQSNPQATAPTAPVADDLSISTEPAQPPAPQPEAESSAFEETETAEAPTPDETVTDVAEPAEQVDAQEEAPETTETAPEFADIAPAAPEAPQAEETSQLAPEVTEDAPTVPEQREQPDAPETPAAPSIPQQTDEENIQTAATELAPRIGKPATSLIGRESGASVRRPADALSTVVDAPNAGEEAAVDAADARPVARFAQAFIPDGDKPLMSIVLIDDGTTEPNGAVGLAALRSFPHKLSIAVDSSIPNAAARVALLRAEGFEVLAMVDLPDGAQPKDVETTLGATIAQMPEIIGILEGPSASLQSAREISDQVAGFLSQSGHGLVSQAKGLNTATTLARKEGVPAKPIFRDFDSKGQSAVVIRRFLDQAAFKADQEGGVIMLGRLRPETITALLLWSLQDRAGQVDIAPVSAVLLQQN